VRRAGILSVCFPLSQFAIPQILRELHASCAPTDDGADVDSSKGTTQLEVYALEIQMYGEMKNNKKLRVRLRLFRLSRPRLLIRR